MQNTKTLSRSRFLNLPKAFVLTLLIAFGGLMAYSISGCSSGPTSPGAGAGMETTTIYGRITDESDAPLMGVTVSGGTQTATTDANGIFILKNATVPQGRAVIIAKKAGYFNAARAESPNSNGTTRMMLSMMSDAATANVSAYSGGTVNSGGASVKFTAGSFTDASGNAYTGTVSVSARYLDPAKSTFYNFFSGDEQAQRLDGSTTNLVSCGVLRVELHDQNGASLKLDPSKPATISCPKPADPKAPATIQLWSFDETLGQWKEEGTATLQGNNYVGTVTHFTDYNFDYCSVPNGLLQFKIVCNNAPINGVVAEVLGRKVVTSPDGSVSIRRVAADGRPVTIDVKAADNGGLYYLNAPVPVTMVKDQTTDAGNITLSSPCPAELRATLICGDGNVEGLVTVSDGKNLSFVYTKTGKWAIQAPSMIPLTVDATDANGNMASTVSVTALASGEQRDIGNISLCGNGTQTYIDIPTDTTVNQQGELIAFSPDGSELASLSLQKLTVYNTTTGKILSQGNVSNQVYYYRSMEFSKDNRKLLLASDYQATQLYDVSGAAIALLVTLPQVSGAKLYDDGSKIIAMQSMVYPNPPVINVYSAADASVLTTLHPFIANVSDSIGSFGLINDENAIVFPDRKTTGTDRVWSVATDGELRNFSVIGTSFTFAASEDALTVASSTDYSSYTCYDVKTGQSRGIVNIAGSKGRYGGLTLTKNNGYAIDQVNGAYVIRVIKISDGTSTIKLLPASSTALSVAASRNEQYLAAATTTKIRVWKLQ
jgi:hypothetical protein